MLSNTVMNFGELGCNEPLPSTNVQVISKDDIVNPLCYYFTNLK